MKDELRTVTVEIYTTLSADEIDELIFDSLKNTDSSWEVKE